MDLTYNVDGIAELNAFLLKLPVEFEVKIKRRVLRAGVQVIKDEVEPSMPVKTGAMRATLRIGTKKQGRDLLVSLKVGNRAKRVFYAHMVEGGTKPHKIRARTAKALHINWNVGNIKFYFPTMVQHPGARAKPFMHRGLVAVGRAVEAVAKASGIELQKLKIKRAKGTL